MPLSHITLKVNGHDVKVTTDQEITDAWAQETVRYLTEYENHARDKLNMTLSSVDATRGNVKYEWEPSN